MGFNLAILISGRGSNMLNIVDACSNKTLSSKVKIIISNNNVNYSNKIISKYHSN